MTRYANDEYVVYVKSIGTHLGFQSESIRKSLEAPEMAVSFYKIWVNSSLPIKFIPTPPERWISGQSEMPRIRKRKYLPALELSRNKTEIKGQSSNV